MYKKIRDEISLKHFPTFSPAWEHAQFISCHQDMYPEEMRIFSTQRWYDDICSTPYSVGMYLASNEDACIAKNLIGWRIFIRENDTTLYVSDLSVLQAWQGFGLASEIVEFSLKLPRWYGETIRSFLRATSYSIVADAELIHRAGYQIVMDRYEPHHYMDEFNLDEDAHELIIKPIGKV